jgi:hypothetical protein
MKFVQMHSCEKKISSLSKFEDIVVSSLLCQFESESGSPAARLHELTWPESR